MKCLMFRKRDYSHSHMGSDSISPQDITIMILLKVVTSLANKTWSILLATQFAATLLLAKGTKATLAFLRIWKSLPPNNYHLYWHALILLLQTEHLSRCVSCTTSTILTLAADSVVWHLNPPGTSHSTRTQSSTMGWSDTCTLLQSMLCPPHGRGRERVDCVQEPSSTGLRFSLCTSTGLHTSQNLSVPTSWAITSSGIWHELLKFQNRHLSFVSNSFCELFSTDINDCLRGACQNGGTCRDGVGNYSCQCLPGFTGENCQAGMTIQ